MPGRLTDETVVVEGLQPMIRDFRRLSRELAGDVRRALKRAAQPVKALAQSYAVGQRLVDSGALVDRIRIYASSTGVRIQEDAMRPPSSGKRGGKYAGAPFPYPNVYEFGGRLGGEAIGPRAWMAPAAETGGPLVEHELEAELGQILG
jgi:hypothetical protein